VVLDLGVEDGRRMSAAIERELLECTNLVEHVGVDGVFGDLGAVDGPSVLG
jgi:ADP-ribose pyrophosphatase YjhB (NUDIX family)